MTSNCGRREFVIKAGGGAVAATASVALAGCGDPEDEPEDGDDGAGYRDGGAEPDPR